MGLIRNQNAAALTRNAVVLNLSDIAGQAELIRRSARNDAEQLIKDAKQLAGKLSVSGNETGYKDGFARGHAAGLAKGLAEGRETACAEMSESIQSGLAAWRAALHEFQARREALHQEARQDVLRLALDIGARVVFRVIETENTTIVAQLADTLRLLAERTAVVIEVNPADLESAEAVMPTLLQQFDCCEDISISVNDTITRGGCYLRTGKGEIDARIETQLQRISETLLPTAAAFPSCAGAEGTASAGHHSKSPSEQGAIPPTAKPPTGADADTSSSSIVDSFLSTDSAADSGRRGGSDDGGTDGTDGTAGTAGTAEVEDSAEGTDR